MWQLLSSPQILETMKSVTTFSSIMISTQSTKKDHTVQPVHGGFFLQPADTCQYWKNCRQANIHNNIGIRIVSHVGNLKNDVNV